MTKTSNLMIALGSVIGLCLAPMALSQTAAPAPKGKITDAVTMKATVTAIDQKTRQVTLKADDGREETIVVGDAAKNLDQIKKGDIVVATYSEAIAYEVKKSGQGGPGASSTTKLDTAKKGEKPGGVVTQQTTLTVTISAIDTKIPTVTFTGPGGNSRTIKVKDPSKLTGVKVGDLVDLTYTEALALSVEKPAAKK
jgi:Cu/Ag efflux protein CusF